MMLLYMLYSDVRCVAAHIPFSDASFDRFAGSYAFVTLLRHPVDRFISNYLWSHKHPEGVQSRARNRSRNSSLRTARSASDQPMPAISAASRHTRRSRPSIRIQPFATSSGCTWSDSWTRWDGSRAGYERLQVAGSRSAKRMSDTRARRAMRFSKGRSGPKSSAPAASTLKFGRAFRTCVRGPYQNDQRDLERNDRPSSPFQL